ncbi:3-hydroxyisobutyrate dehydrogenase [Pseudomonas sp. BN411]|uniref:3-hydroxyisobutyrate dehydrogenase n=1 Tax=Pseudomonas sp. BN411 TaxID=2567887 RepID=UPI0024588D40|nr:3-hydroxyisobutyrate dehydrogenase [Pseudomonas sp. BN411]MDH4564226.1 3-hydroxyisobutyrate dehydrogenase [Pseudomonas sp. BN411]
MKTVAWIGLGFMGNPMSKNMIKAGYTVRGYDIDPDAISRATKNGVIAAYSVAEAVKGAEVIYTMLPTGKEVKEVLTGPNGVFANAAPGALVIDCSTIGIDTAGEIHESADAFGARFVEAPVSGGTEGARDATLTFMMGGKDEDIPQAAEMLKPLGEYIAHVGGPKAGQAAKVVNNLIMAVCLTVNCEATALAERLGLDLKAMFEIIIRSSGDNWTFRTWNPAPGVVAEAPSSHEFKAGFKTWLLAKDLSLALTAGRSVGLNISTAEAAHALMSNHVQNGGADMDATSLVLTMSTEAQKATQNKAVA